MDDLTHVTASELAAAIRARRVSAREALDAHMRRIERHNPALNAVVTMNPRAEDEARAADDALARGEAPGPLHGVPITIKDCFETAGLRTTNGHEPTAGYVPVEDAPTVAKLRAAGAVMIGKTNLPNLADDFQTYNPIFGRTDNPWNLDCTPGGSSGGESAAIAARLTPLGLGSDNGGSIRQPAHCTAIFGIKPTENLVSTAGYLEGRGTPKAERYMNHIGPMARSIADLELALRVVAGPDRRFLETPPVALPPGSPRPVRGLRVAWASRWPDLPAERTIGDALAKLAGDLASAGATVEEASPPDFDVAAARLTYGALLQAQLGATMDAEIERRKAEEGGVAADSPDPFLRGSSRTVNCSMRTFAEVLTERDRWIVAWERFFDTWDLFVCPLAATPAPHHMPMGAPVEIDGSPYPYWLAMGGFTDIFDLIGGPAIALPLGVATDGRPFGYQVVGRRWNDIELLTAAASLAMVSGPCPLPPGYYGSDEGRAASARGEPPAGIATRGEPAI